MKKNKGLIAGLIAVVILAAVGVWYFFFRGQAASKLNVDTGVAGGTGGTGTSTPCPAGTSGVFPNCTLNDTNSDAIFSSAIALAKQNVTNNTKLTNVQKLNAINIIDIDVAKDKDTLVATASSGKDTLNELILRDAEKIYLLKYNVAIVLSNASKTVGGFGG